MALKNVLNTKDSIIQEKEELLRETFERVTQLEGAFSVKAKKVEQVNVLRGKVVQFDGEDR